jgi:hypothetical protein
MFRLLLIFAFMTLFLAYPKNALAVIFSSKYPPQYAASKNNHFLEKWQFKKRLPDNESAKNIRQLVKSVSIITFLGLAGLGLALITSSFAVYFLSVLLTYGAIIFGLIVLIIVCFKKEEKTQAVLKLLRNLALSIVGLILIYGWAQRKFD